MKYTVTWHPDAKDELARIWIAATDRQAVADAAVQIDHRLRHAPERLGDD